MFGFISAVLPSKHMMAVEAQNLSHERSLVILLVVLMVLYHILFVICLSQLYRHYRGHQAFLSHRPQPYPLPPPEGPFPPTPSHQKRSQSSRKVTLAQSPPPMTPRFPVFSQHLPSSQIQTQRSPGAHVPSWDRQYI